MPKNPQIVFVKNTNIHKKKHIYLLFFFSSGDQSTRGPLTKLFSFSLSVMEKNFSHYEQTDGRSDGRTNGWTDERTNGRTDERTDGLTDGRTNRWTDGNNFFKVGMVATISG